MWKIVFTILCISLMTLCPPPAKAEKPYVISWGFEDSGYPDMTPFQDILKEAYARIGMEVSFGSGLLARAYEDACTRQTDASAFRSRGAVGAESNLVQVPVVLLRDPFAAFTTNPDLNITSWDDLKGLKVGQLSGVRSITIRAKSAGIPVTQVKGLAQGFKMLDQGRLDVFIAESLVGMDAARKHGVEQVFVSQPLFTVNMYHYVNKHHEDLVPPLTKAFRSMFNDGTMRRLISKYHPMLPVFETPAGQ